MTTLDRALDLGPGLIDERTRGAEMRLSRAVLLAEGVAIAQPSGRAGLVAGECGDLVEGTPADAEREAGIPNDGKARRPMR